MLCAALFFLSVGNVILDIIVILALAFYVIHFIRAQKRRKNSGNAPVENQTILSSRKGTGDLIRRSQ